MIFKQKRMKQRIIILIGVAICYGLTACALGPKKAKMEKPLCAEWLMPDSLAYHKLGKRLASILFAPQSVRCFHLIGKEKIEDGEIQIEENFVRDTLLSSFRPNEIAVLQYALLKPAKSYETDSIKVMSPYIPVLEFEFSKKNEKAHVVISLSDMTWTVYYDDKRQFHYNYANEELIYEFCKFYIRKYKSKIK